MRYTSAVMKGEPQSLRAEPVSAKIVGSDEVAPEVREGGVSVIIPAFNEEESIEGAIATVRDTMQGLGVPFEIVVVNDGSRDKTRELATAAGVTVVDHVVNRGYGA